MISGVGVDIVDVSRIAKALDHPRFRDRIFTSREQQLCRSPQEYAGRWAAKEAIAKALRPMRLSWLEVEIDRDPQGAPIAKINGARAFTVHVTISHERGFAVAFAIAERF